MPPQSHLISKAQSLAHQWPWNQSLNGNQDNNKLKRLTTEDAVTITKRIRKNSEKLPIINNKKAAIVLPKPKVIPIAIEDETQPQTKITGYFKSQVKKKCLPNNCPKELEKHFQDLNYNQNLHEFDIRTLNTMTPSLKKIDRKQPKVSPVVLLSRNQKLAPKKPVTIAPRTSKPKPLMNVKPQDDQSKSVQQPTVVLTAIRIPQQPTLPPPKTIPTNKVGPVYQFQPVMPNLVQIPNLINKNSNLVMNNGGQLSRLNNTTQYFVNGGTVIKLTQTNGTSGTTSIVTVDSGISNILGGKSSTVPFTSNLPIHHQQSQKLNGSSATHIAQQVYMTTSSGILLNTALPSFTGIQTINQQATLPALHPIQPHTALPSISTMLPNNHHPLTSYQQQQHHQTSYLTQHSSTYSKLSVHPNFVTNQLNTGLVTTYSTIKNPAPQLLTEPPKLVPCTLKIETAFPTIPVLPQQNGSEKIFDLCSPTIPLLSPKEPQQHCLASPKSLILERIRQKTLFELSTYDMITESPRIDTEFQTASLPECAKSPILSQPKTIRFPAEYTDVIRVPGSRVVRKSDGRIVGMCYWDKCNAKYDTCSKLLDHLQTQHVNLQTGPFSCLWSGCKVHSRESCSRRWLERHVLSHGGTKPFKCIVGGCGLRFGSQVSFFSFFF